MKATVGPERISAVPATTASALPPALPFLPATILRGATTFTKRPERTAMPVLAPGPASAP